MKNTGDAHVSGGIRDRRLPVYFISHGGGPWPWIPEMRDRYEVLAASLADIPRQIGRKPRAILMVSAHWEAERFSVQSALEPGMLYDYGGFPAHTYRVNYPSPGSPVLAERVRHLLNAAGIDVQTDGRRGYDHGMFSPMAVIYPEADVPVVQLSLRRGLDPAEHLALGHALSALRNEEVLIIGSGLSYHNLRAFGPEARVPSKAFDDWLAETMLQNDSTARTLHLLNWEKAPAARFAHPREEHLLPLMVAVGAAEDNSAVRIYHEENFMGGLAVSSYRLDS